MHPKLVLYSCESPEKSVTVFTIEKKKEKRKKKTFVQPSLPLVGTTLTKWTNHPMQYLPVLVQINELLMPKHYQILTSDWLQSGH